MYKHSKLNLQKLEELMENKYTLVWISREDSLCECTDILNRCMKARSAEPLIVACDEWYHDYEMQAIDDIVFELKQTCRRVGYADPIVDRFFRRNEERIRETIRERDNSQIVDRLISYTDALPIRIEMLSNYDCINSHYFESYGGYSYMHSYFGDMVDALNLNPRRVQQLLAEHDVKCEGLFPDLRERNGQEQVSYNDFWQELENSCCGANLLTYIATVDLKELYATDFNATQITIPKGNRCGLFSSMQGGGSVIEMELQYDVTLNLNVEDYHGFRLLLDSEAYSIKEVYSVFDSFFKKPAQLNLQQNSAA